MTGGVRPALDLAFGRVDDRTVLTRRRYRWPLLIGRVFADPLRPWLGSVTIQNAGGTVIPGDLITQHIEVLDGAAVVLRGQGATVVSGVAGGAQAVEQTRVRVDAGSRVVLDVAPRILNRHAHYRQYTEVCVESGGGAVLVDAVVLHPELAERGPVNYESSVAVVAPDGALRALDVQALDSVPTVLRPPMAFGTVYVLGAGPPSTNLSTDLEQLTVLTGDRRTYIAVSELPGQAGWAVRIATWDGGALRAALGAVTAQLDVRIFGASWCPRSSDDPNPPNHRKTCGVSEPGRNMIHVDGAPTA